MAGESLTCARRSVRAAVVTLLLLGCTARNPAFIEPPPPGDDASIQPDLGPLEPELPPEPYVPPDAAASAPDADPPDASSPPADLAPDLPVDKPPPGAALLVVGDVSPLHSSDVQLRSSLTRLGFTVMVRDGADAVAADAGGKSLVVISGSAWSDDVGAAFRDVAVPVVCFDRAVFAPMKLTGTRSGTDYGELDNARSLMIIDGSHPLAGGLSGQVTVANADMMLSWGVPSDRAIRVATTTGNANRFTIFAYEAGESMVDMNAPARRVGSFVRYPRDATYTESGLLLFEASALWAIGHR